MTLKNKINYSMTSKMNIFLNELFLSFFEIIRTEKAFMKGIIHLVELFKIILTNCLILNVINDLKKQMSSMKDKLRREHYK